MEAPRTRVCGGHDSVGICEGEDNGGLRSHYQELLQFRWRQMQEGKKTNSRVTEVCLSCEMSVEPQDNV